MSQPGRVVTALIVIDEPENAGWLWDAMKGETINGVRIDAIANGSVFDEAEVMEQGLKHIAGHIIAEEDKELEELYDDSERADEILERASRCDKKYEYDSVLCRYTHNLIKPLPGKTIGQAGNGGNEGGLQDQT